MNMARRLVRLLGRQEPEVRAAAACRCCLVWQYPYCQLQQCYCCQAVLTHIMWFHLLQEIMEQAAKKLPKTLGKAAEKA